MEYEVAEISHACSPTPVSTPSVSVKVSKMSSYDIGVPPGVDLDATRGPYLLWVCVSMIILSTLAVGLRFLSRKLAGLTYLFDDWTILIALVGPTVHRGL